MVQYLLDLEIENYNTKYEVRSSGAAHHAHHVHKTARNYKLHSQDYKLSTVSLPQLSSRAEQQYNHHSRVEQWCFGGPYGATCHPYFKVANSTLLQQNT